MPGSPSSFSYPDPVQTIPLPKAGGRRIVVGDIHGCLATLRHLVEEAVQLRPEDQLFLLGDYIDRGPSSSGVLDYVMQLPDEGYQVFPLRGNHEENALGTEVLNAKFRRRVFKMNKATDLLGEDGALIPRYADYMDSLPLCYQTEGYLLVHGNINMQAAEPLADHKAFLWQRDYDTEVNHAWLAGRQIVYGHTPNPLASIRQAITRRAPLLPLDNGCVYAGRTRHGNTEGLGCLCALELGTHQLWAVENRDRG